MFKRIVILAGGTGGTKFAVGASVALPDARGLTVLANPGDDVERHGLYVSPDTDMAIYALAGLLDEARGYGLTNESFRVLEALGRLGEETWFRLGDLDLATHIYRTKRLTEGARMSEVALEIGARLKARGRVLPPSDDPVRTIVETDRGDLGFQEFFVREKCAPEIRGVRYEGAEAARIAPEARDAIRSAEVIFFGPSNPIASIGPILAVREVREEIDSSPAPKVAVSPLIGGKSLKGPSDRMLPPCGYAADVTGVAQYYAGLVDAMVIDAADADLAAEVEKTGARAFVAETRMRTLEEKANLARAAFAAAREVSAAGTVSRA